MNHKSNDNAGVSTIVILQIIRNPAKPCKHKYKQNPWKRLKGHNFASNSACGIHCSVEFISGDPFGFTLGLKWVVGVSV